MLSLALLWMDISDKGVRDGGVRDVPELVAPEMDNCSILSLIIGILPHWCPELSSKVAA